MRADVNNEDNWFIHDSSISVKKHKSYAKQVH